jgi:hypothetical protein
MGCATEESAFDSREGQEIFLFSIKSRSARGPTHPLIQTPLWAVSPGGGGREARACEEAHSPPPSAEVRKDGAVPSLLHTS